MLRCIHGLLLQKDSGLVFHRRTMNPKIFIALKIYGDVLAMYYKSLFPIAVFSPIAFLFFMNVDIAAPFF